MRGATSEETMELFGAFLPKGPEGEISFEIISPKASYGDRRFPLEGIYRDPDVPYDPKHPMCAVLVVENAADGNSQTIYVFAKSMEGAQKLNDLFNEGKIPPQVTLEEAPAAVRRLLSRKRQRLIMANKRK